ncbi:MAG: hypothetical protein R3F39_23885 [Myxococcota bacterium]
MARSDYASQGLPAASARRRRRAARALGVLVLTVVGLGLVVGRCVVERTAAESASQRGAAALLRAISGDPTAWPEVDQAFGDAARGGFLGVDAYALFVLELTQRLRAGETPIEEPSARAVVRAMAAGDFDSAKAGLEAVGDARAKSWLARLLEEIEIAREESRARPAPKLVIDPLATQR